MKTFNWNDEKNRKLRETRNVSFEDVLFCIQNKQILDIVENPNQDKYPGQKYFILSINDYVYYVPFIENEKEIFLKTIIPSRKYTKAYLGGKNGL